MQSRIALGAGAGLAGGLIAAFILWILGIKGHEGQIASPITLLSHLVGSSNLAAGGLVLIVVGTAVGGALRRPLHGDRASPRFGGLVGDALRNRLVDRRLVRGDAASAAARAVGSGQSPGALPAGGGRPARVPRIRHGARRRFYPVRSRRRLDERGPTTGGARRDALERRAERRPALGARPLAGRVGLDPREQRHRKARQQVGHPRHALHDVAV